MIPTPRQARQLAEIPAPVTFLLALVFSFATTGLLLLFNQLETINKTTIALVFLLPVGLSATLWGLLPGIVAALTSFLAFNYYFIKPIHSFTVHDSEDLVILAAFLGVAVVISELAARIKRNLDSATAREHEALLLFELSNLLAGTQDERAAAQAILDKIYASLHPGRIEVMIEATPEPVILTREGYLPRTIPLRPSIVPMQTARGLLGEIRLWREEPLRESEQRFLETCASQGVLAIERGRLTKAESKAKVLEESDQLKSSLLSSVSHELRSPLAAIKASVSSLRSGEVEWETQARTELLATVEEEIDHLNILVGNLLDMSRIESGALHPQQKPNLLAEIVSTVLLRLKTQLRGYQIKLDLPENLPFVLVDFVQMEQVFVNLIGNSLKYAPPGSAIGIAARAGKDEAQVTLTNQGPGVPEEHLERIFDKFYRLDPTDRVTGSGLGLSICKGIIEAHGGKIWAENLPNGFAFHFTLPVIK